ncbi:hypothetical protein L9F63_017549 [Diploptera punctata]|uniref:CRAL-TRIO domain-containing protein n=1 Tax=Diploptera punctata TaxID=6984 RepID=A0AAD7ZYH1_DIPPU|nr:hypothetical protein L9F63_017549 [Diploptera punctata]
MLLDTPTEEQLARMREELKDDEYRMKQDVEHMRHWLTKQPHLPHHMEDDRLARFVYGCKLDVSRAKRVLETYYTVRSTVPELFSNRDPQSADMQLCFAAVDYVPLPVLTPSGYRATLLCLRECDPDKFNVRSITTRILNSLDLRLRMEPRCLNNIMLIDLQGFTMAHYSKLSPTHALSRKALLCIQDAFPLRLAQVHFINAPAFIGNIMKMFRPFLKEKLFNKFHFHCSGFESLHQQVPPEVLPQEYGGLLESTRVLTDRWNAELVRMRDWLLTEQRISKSDESRRPSGSCNVTASALINGDEVHGTFRKLSID